MEPIRRPLTFDEVKRAHRSLAAQNPAYAGMDLPTFARHANKVTGTDFFAQGDVGVVGRTYKEFSTGFDKLLEPVSNVARSAGGKVGSMFGSRGEDIGEMVGESLPRGAIDTLTALGGLGMMAVPGLQVPGAALTAAGLGSTFAKTATDTGSPLAGGVSAVATALLPKFAEFGIKKVLPFSKAAGTATEKAVGGGVGGLAERAVEYGGAQAGGLLNEQIAQQGVSLAAGEGFQNPLTAENIAQSAAGVLAFAPFDAPMLAKGYRTTKDGRVVPHDITSMFQKGSTARSLADFGRQQDALAEVQKKITEVIAPPVVPPSPTVAAAPDVKAVVKTPTFEPYKGPVDDLSHGDAREVQGPPTMNPVEAINKVEDPQIKSALETFAKQMGPFQQTPIDSTVPVREDAKPVAQSVIQPNVLLDVLALESVGGDKTKIDQGRRYALGAEFTGEAISKLIKLEDPRALDLLVSSGLLEKSLIGYRLNQATYAKDIEQYRLKKAKPAQLEIPSEQFKPIKGFDQGGTEDVFFQAGESRREGLQYVAESEELAAQYAEGGVFGRPGAKVKRLVGKLKIFDTTLSDEAERTRILGSENLKYIEPDGHVNWNAFEHDKSIKERLKAAGYDAIRISEGENGVSVAVLDESYRKLKGTTSPAEQFKVVKGSDQTESAAPGEPIELGQFQRQMEELQDAWEITRNAPVARRQIEQKMKALAEKYGAVDFKPGETKILEMAFKEPPAPLSENQPYVRDLLEKVDELTGGDIQQMAKAHENAAKTVVVGKKGKVTDVDVAKQAALSSLSDMAARLAGMPAGLRAQGEAGALMATGEKFFRSLFTQRGYDSPTIDRLTKVGLRSLTMFDAASRTKIVSSANDRQNFHWSAVGGIENAVVALSERFFKAKDLEVPGLFYALNHEMTHDLQMRMHNVTPEQLAADPKLERYAKSFEEIKKLTPQEKTDLFVTLIRSVFPLDKLSKDAQTEMNKFFETRARVYASDSGDIESLADIGAILGMGLASKNSVTISELKDIARFSDTILKDFQMGYYSDLTGVIDALGDFLDKVWSQDNLNQWGIRALPGVRGDSVKSIAKAATEVMKANLESEQGIRMLMEISNRQYPPLLGAGLKISHDQAMRAGLVEGQLGLHPSKTSSLEFKNFVKDLEGLMFRPEDAERFNGVRPGLLSNLIPMNQMAAKHPVLRPVFDLAYSFRGESAKMANKLLRPFYDANGKIDEAFLTKMMRPGQVNDALNKLALLQNEVERGYNDAEFNEIAGKLSKEDQEFVKDAMNRIGQANVLAAKSRVEFFGKDVVNQMTHIVMTQAHHFAGVKLTEAMAGRVADAVWQKVSKNLPTTSFVNSIPPAVYAKLEQFAGVMKPKAVEIADAVLGEGHQGKPWWSSEVRLGKWMLSWRDNDGKANVLGFKSEREQVDRARKLESEGNRVTTWNRQDRMEAFRGLPGDAIERFAEADRVAFEAMLKTMDGELTPEQINDIRELFTPGQGAAMLTTPAQMQERQLVGGREETNLMEGVLHNLTSTAFGLAKRYVKGRMGVVLYSPELRQNPDLQNKMRIYLNDIVNMPGKEFHTLKNMVFTHYMALNISSLIIEPTQNFVAHVPHLIRKGAGVGEAYKHVFSGLRQAAAYAWGKGPKMIDDAMKHSNILRAFEEDVVGLGFLQEITTFEDANYMAARDLATKGTVTTSVEKAGQLVKDVAYWGLHLSRNFYGLATKLNSVASFIAGYDYALSKGMDHEQAYSFAKEGTQTTTQIGSRASRPLVIARMKEFAGVGGLAYTLQSYTFNMLSMAARWGAESISKSVPKDQQKQARKAFAVMMGTQAALGGAMGLPMTAGAIALIEEFFPDVEVQKGMREWFASLGGDDAGVRDLVADGAMNGLVNALGPFDLGSRMQMSSVMGINPYDGFSFQNIFGPAANMLTNYTKALSAGTTGDFYSLGRGLAPNSLKNIIDLVHNDFVERDKVGKLLFEPNGSELLSRVVGFKPKRLSKYYEQMSLLKRSAEIDAREKQRFYEDLADNVMETGDWSAVRLALIQKSKETTGFDAREGARRIAEIVQQRTTPVDLYRGGRHTNIDERAELARAYGPPQQSNNVQLLMQRKALEKNVGLPGSGRIGRRELTTAQMVDQVMRDNPFMTTEQAEFLVRQALDRRRAF